MVYEPAEDSYLLQKSVERYARGAVLEIGIGSGILSETAAKSAKVKSVLGVDIDRQAVDHCKWHVKDKKCRFRYSDLFSKVRGKFDTIIFNPPYLPEDRREDRQTALATTGGKKGYEIIERFLEEAGDHLATGGQILLLFSTLTKKNKVEEFILQNLFDQEETGRVKIPFETLFVYRLQKMKIRKVFEKKGITNLRRLTKGHRGFIFTGMVKVSGRGEDLKVAIKMQRPDIDAAGTVDIEAKVLRVLNKKGIGPKLLFYGKDYFVYEFVTGDFIFDWLDKKPSRKRTKHVLLDVYEQMYLLDKMKMNKEEMHHPYKHVVITKDDDAVLLDFERCRKREKRHNVTQFTQFIATGKMKMYLDKMGIKLEGKKLLDLARDYKKDYRREKLDKIIELIK